MAKDIRRNRERDGSLTFRYYDQFGNLAYKQRFYGHTVKQATKLFLQYIKLEAMKEFFNQED